MSDGDETPVSLFIIFSDSGPGRGVSILGAFNIIQVITVRLCSRMNWVT